MDFWGKHKKGFVEFTVGDKAEEVTLQDWTNAVYNFVDQIIKFYGQYSTKSIIEETELRVGWAELWKEISVSCG